MRGTRQPIERTFYRKNSMLEHAKQPLHGEIYEAVEDFDITYRTINLTSYTGGGMARFPAGERLVVDTCGRNNIKVYCDAVHYTILENRIVPEKTRALLTYSGYYFHIAIKTLHKHCRRISIQ